MASTSNSFQFHRRHIGGDTAPQARAQLNRTYLRAKHWHGRSHHGCSNFPSAFQVRLAPEPQRPRSCPLFMSTTCVDILSTNLVDTRRWLIYHECPVQTALLHMISFSSICRLRYAECSEWYALIAENNASVNASFAELGDHDLSLSCLLDVSGRQRDAQLTLMPYCVRHCVRYSPRRTRTLTMSR